MTGFILNNVMLSTFLIKHPYSSWEDKTSIMVRFLFSFSNKLYTVVVLKNYADNLRYKNFDDKF